ncbi:MAG: hypothetical protein IID03_12540 [Candidatus Dadabacteria bacterium]|nr:hypothetical protein [Candidatus Dadabacteria bacterium]
MPNKPARVTVVMPKEWHEELKAIADRDSNSVNNLICETIRKRFGFTNNKRPRGRPKKHLK